MRMLLALVLLALPSSGRYNSAPSAEAGGPATAATAPAAASSQATTQAMQRRTIYFTGKVQGVGFRATAVDLSRGLDLAGEVRNMPDGRVELIVEGSPAGIDKLISRLREHFGDYIRKVEQTTSSPQGMSRGVRITY